MSPSNPLISVILVSQRWFKTCVGELKNSQGKLSDTEIQKWLSELEKIYDNEWYKELRNLRNGHGPCALTLLGGVQSPITAILRLGQNLKTIGGVENLENELLTRLRNEDEFLNAALEIEDST